MKTHLLKAGLLVVVVGTVIGTITAFSSFKSKSASSTVTFINKYWSNMHLQVRVGNSSNPESNPIAYDGNLGKSPVTIPFDVLLWYRRDANPDRPDGNFTRWTQCFSSQTIDNP